MNVKKRNHLVVWRGILAGILTGQLVPWTGWIRIAAMGIVTVVVLFFFEFLLPKPRMKT